MIRPTDKSTVRINPRSLFTPPGYSHIVRVSCQNLFFISGQSAIDQYGSIIYPGDLSAQLKQTFRNLHTALQAIDCSAANLVKLTVYLVDMSDLARYRVERDLFFSSTSPAASPAITLVQVPQLFAPELMVEIDAIAAS